MSAWLERRWLGWGSMWLLYTVLALALYWQALPNPLIFDDVSALSHGPEGIFELYGPQFTLRPRWLSYGSFVLHSWWVGENWWAHRLVNVLLHGLTASVLFGFARALLRRALPEPPASMLQAEPGAEPCSGTVLAALACALFVLHPIAVYAVAYLVERSVVLVTLFGTLFLWTGWTAMCRQEAGQRSWGLWALSLLWYVLAVSSKEHAVTAPLLLLAMMYTWFRSQFALFVKRYWSLFLLFFVVAVIMAWPYRSIIGSVFDEVSRHLVAVLKSKQPGVENHVYGLSIMNQAALFFKHCFLWLVPYHGWMAVDMRESFPTSFLSWPRTLGALGFVAYCALGVYFLRRQNRPAPLDASAPPASPAFSPSVFAAWPWAWTGWLMLAPALLFVTEFGTVWIQDPFVLYKGYWWFSVMPLVYVLLLHRLRAWAVFVVTAVLAGLLVCSSWNRLQTLQSPQALWSDVIRWAGPGYVLGIERAYNGRALAEFEAGAWDAADADFSTVLNWFPDEVDARANRCGVRLAQQRWQEAARDCEWVLKLQPQHRSARHNWASALLNLGQSALAEQQLRQLIQEAKVRADGELLNLQQSYGSLLLQQQRYAELDQLLADMQTTAPNASIIALLRSKARQAQQDWPGLVAASHAGLAHDPHNTELWLLQALGLQQQQRLHEALQAASQVLDIDASHVEARILRGNLNQALGQNQAALFDFNQVLQAVPNEPRTLALRAMVWLQLQQPARARQDARLSCQAGLAQGCALLQKIEAP